MRTAFNKAQTSTNRDDQYSLKDNLLSNLGSIENVTKTTGYTKQNDTKSMLYRPNYTIILI